MVASWPGAWNPARALALGFQGVGSFDEIVRAYIEDDLRPSSQPSAVSMTPVR
jgi:hypothetical protein